MEFILRYDKNKKENERSLSKEEEARMRAKRSPFWMRKSSILSKFVCFGTLLGTLPFKIVDIIIQFWNMLSFRPFMITVTI